MSQQQIERGDLGENCPECGRRIVVVRRWEERLAACPEMGCTWSETFPD